MENPRRTYQEREWVARIRKGDEEAFETLFKIHCEELRRYALSLVHIHEVAEDLVCDLFCDLWDQRRDWKPQGVIKSYLLRAVRNRSLNWLKHRRIERRWEAEKKHRGRQPQEGPEDVLRSRELEQAMQQAIEALPERRRCIYKMSRHEGKSYAEIAAALGISPKTVENQIRRALKFLRVRLATFA